MRMLVAGAAGFIGGHLVRRLLDDGHWVRAVDVQPLAQWKQVHRDARNWDGWDLLRLDRCQAAVKDTEWVYHLAADTGGMGYIAAHRADCMLNTLIDVNMILASRSAAIERFYFASSSCVYPVNAQQGNVPPELAEHQVWPADPEPGYGFSKLHTEQLLDFARQDWDFTYRAGRHQSLYGPQGWYDGGREKVPTALCRKIALAKLTGQREIEVWGDGTQVRDFVYISDAIEAIIGIMHSAYEHPLNLGSGTPASVAELAAIIGELAGWPVRLRTVAGPTGVQGRSTNTTLVAAHASWKPKVGLREGLALTYPWVYDQVRANFNA